jgi:putative FmdB family regulatory protein
VPIFVYRCGCGHRFERLVPREAAAPACPECGDSTHKVPAGSSLTRGAARRSATPPSTGRGSVPIPWRGVVAGGPEKVQREVEFRQRLEAKAVSGLRTPGGPDRPTPPSGETSGSSPSPTSD